MPNRKFIKKLSKTTAVLLLLIFAVPATAFLLLQSSSIQTSLANRIMQYMSEELDTKFTINKLNITFPYRLRLNDVYLEDLSGDTLLYVKSLTGAIRYVNPLKNEILISSITIDKATVGLAIDSAKVLNLKYFINKLNREGKGEKKGWKIKFNNIKLRNSRFYLRNYYYKPVESGINFTDLLISDLNADIKRFNPSRDSLSFYIKALQFKEKCGLKITKLTGEFSQSKTFLSFRDISLLTSNSSIRGDEITLQFNDWSEFKTDLFYRNIKLKLLLNDTWLNLSDVGYFAPVFYNTYQLVTLSGQIKGPVGNLKGKNIAVGFGKISKLKGELNLEGLPDIHSTFLFAVINELTTSAEDLKALHLPKQDSIKVPEQFDKLGLITYKGRFTGFINDFVAYGKFNTGLGVINTDLLFRPDTLNSLDFTGELTVQDFDLGTLFNASKNLGKISLSASVNGTSSVGKSISAALKGMIQRFEFRKYKYTNINLSGNLKNKTYNGSIIVDDPNIELEFLGQVNLSDSIPTFDFTANVTDANPYALNIDRSDPNFRVSFYLIANARGNSINSLNGEIKLLNSLFTKKDQQLQIYDFNVLAVNETGNNHLQLKSDFMDAEISGNYELTKAKELFQSLLYAYLPSFHDTLTALPELKQKVINLKANLKNSRPLFDFFLPDYYLADKSYLTCSYYSDDHELKMLLQTPQLIAKGITWNGLIVSMSGNNDLLDFEAGGEDLTLGGRNKLENFTIYSEAGNDSVNLEIRWNNWKDIQFLGNIKALAKISRKADQRNPYVDFYLYPSTITTNDTVWSIQPGKVSIDSTFINIDQLMVFHGNEYFRLEGALSENPADKIELLFNQFNLGNLNSIAQASGYELGGILNGKTSVSNIYKSTLFTSKLNIDSLCINGEMLGNTVINSTWDDKRKAIDIDAYAMRDNLKTFDIQGEYLPAGQGKLSFDIVLDKLRLNIFNPYIRSIFSDLRGMASGRAKLSGTFVKPVLNGELNLQKTAFTVNYLKTRFNFSEKIQIENNNVYFKNVRIFDPKGNSAYLNGAIRNKYLKDFQLDLNIRSEDFLCLNTTYNDNKLFYGKAYATGIIKISGPPRNIIMDISAITSKNTSIKIPLSNEGELDEYNFITVITEDSVEEKEETTGTNYQVDLSGMQINMDLTVTPDAEVQIIFDPKLGDIIKGKGNGNLDMKINTAGNFLMFGEFNIEEGDYLFTLQNFINKKFNIEPGGRIRWNGDPLDATIDIVANYRTRASLNDLLGRDDERSRAKIIVDDRLTMTGKLMAPDVKYDINLPNADEATRLILSNAITSNEDLNKQFISLLIQNRFVLGIPGGHASGSNAGSPYSSAAGVNASEFLSNQLSNWLSQISNDVDVGVNYRSNREMKSDEVQVALSTQLFNDRLSINGSVDVATNASAYASDNIVGEFDIDYKITENGKLRIKTFNHANNDVLYEYSPYTQGLGMSYKEEFNTLGELIKHYWKSIFGTKKEEDQIESAE